MSMIRSTYHGRLSALAAEVSRNGATLARAQLEASSGLRYFSPADDPGMVSRIHAMQAEIEEQSVYQDSASWATGIQATAEEVLSHISDLLTRTRELATQMSSEEKNPQQVIDAAQEAQGLYDQMVSLANSTFGGRFVFAGNAYDTQPFSTVGVYGGDTGQPSVEVGQGLRASTGFDGSAMLQGTTDIFASVASLVTALGTGVAANVALTLDPLKDALQQVTGSRTEVGTQLALAEDAAQVSESLEVELKSQFTNFVEVDQAKSYMRMAQLQTTYETTLQVTASSRYNLLFERL